MNGSKNIYCALINSDTFTIQNIFIYKRIEVYKQLQLVVIAFNRQP
jgi:hypothetical protein